MPIGIALGTAAIGAGGAYLASKSQSKAINNANETTQENNAANLAFMRDMYGQNTAQLAPWSWGGMEAGNALLGMLLPGYKPKSLPGMPLSGAVGGGGGATAPGGTPVGTGGAGGASGAPYTQAQINAMWHNNIPGDAEAAQQQLNAWLQSHPGATAGAPSPAGAPFTESQIGDMWHDGISGNAASAESALSAWLASHPPAAAPATPTAPAPTGAPAVNSEAAFNALPSGTRFTAPDGTQRIKP